MRFAFSLAVGLFSLFAPAFLAQGATFEQWRDSYFTGYSERYDMRISGIRGDADHDGIPNLIEYALGLNPTVANISSLPAEAFESGHLTLTYSRPKNLSELTYKGEVSSDLKGVWNSGTGYVETVSITDQGSTELVKYRNVALISANLVQFLRLSVVPTFPDTDNDSLPDWWERNYYWGDLTYASGTSDYYDGDGLEDGEEYQLGTDPTNWDSDGDLLDDGDEVHIYHTNPLKIDTDDDGMPDDFEIGYGLNPLVNDALADLDNDGLDNIDEYNLGTTVNDPDTDNDGLTDGWEVTYGCNPFVADSQSDKDHDGLSAIQEFLAGSDPRNADTDGDGLSDYAEIQIYGTNPTLGDTDNDGMPDKWEIDHATNAIVYDGAVDADSDGLSNFQEFQLGTDPQLADTDGDGRSDSQETDTSRLLGDTDGDLLPDGLELFWTLNPMVDNSLEDPDEDGLGRSLELLAERSSAVADSPEDMSDRNLDVYTLITP